MDPAVKRAIAAIPDDHWTPIKYPKAVWDDNEGRWVYDAQVAGIGLTAFTSRRTSEHVTARLIVHRVQGLNPASISAGQDELFTTWRRHAVFADSPLAMLTPATFTTFMARHRLSQPAAPDLHRRFVRAGLVRGDRTVIGT